MEALIFPIKEESFSWDPEHFKHLLPCGLEKNKRNFPFMQTLIADWFLLFISQSDLSTFEREEGNLGHQVTPRAQVWSFCAVPAGQGACGKCSHIQAAGSMDKKGQEFFEDENLSVLWSQNPCRNHQAAGTPSKQGLRGRRNGIYHPLVSVASFFIKKRSLLLVCNFTEFLFSLSSKITKLGSPSEVSLPVVNLHKNPSQ